LSTLYIRLVSKAAAGNAPEWHALPCRFALVSHGGAIERQGTAPLPDLSGTIAGAQRVVVVVAASDVTVLRLHVPPLSPARLKAALPNLVEDQLIADPADCVVVAGDLSDGLCTIAVAERAWIELLARTLEAFGARLITALPAQLCLPLSGQSGQSGQPGSVTAAIDDANGGIEMTLRMSEQEGIGLAIAHQGDDSALHVAIRTLAALVPQSPVVLYLPQSLAAAYQDAVNDTIAPGMRISVSVDNWSGWIAGARRVAIDLMTGLGKASRPGLDWRPWRWPLALASAILVINLAALDIGWWQMKSEARSLQATMIQLYKSAFPKESVIIDPLAQMQQKIALAKHDSGLTAPDDFTAITAAVGEAWPGIAQAAAGKPAPAIAELEYHDHILFVHLKPAGDIPTQAMSTALAKFGLAVDLAPADSGAVVWKIRSSK
jgi:general secretion pathway protein L